MLTGSIRLITLSAVFAFAAHGASIGLEGGSCSGDPSFDQQIVSFNADDSGNACPVYTNNLPSGDPGGGTQAIGSLTITTALSASPSDTEFTCFTTKYFADCNVIVDPTSDLLTVQFFNHFFIGNLDFVPSRGIEPGDTFDINVSGFSSNQSFDAAANEPLAPEPGSVVLVLAGGLASLFARRRASCTR